MRYAALLAPVVVLGLVMLALAGNHETVTTQPASGDHDAHHGHDADGHHAHDEHAGHDHDTHADHALLVPRAIAVLSPTEGNAVTGKVMFEQLDANRVRITAEVSGLTPNAKHGFHIHEYGDISAPDGTATGGHYNPESHDHALPHTADERHAGDLGNLQTDPNGHASFGLIVEGISIAGTKNPVIGRGVIVHANPDDGGQPVGNAGPRIAQGVIGVAK